MTTTLMTRLRETLGEDAANDLVAWVERSSERDMHEVRRLIDAYYDRFDARLEQRLAEQRAELRVELRSELATLRVEMAAQRSDMSAQRSELIRWMFRFWAGTVIPLAVLMVALIRL